VAEGDLVVMRALEVGLAPELIICDESALPTLEGIGDRLSTALVVTANEATRKAATGLGVALPIVALFPKPTMVDHGELISRNDRIIVLSQVDNPTNVGAIVRSAAAFGFTGLVLDGESSDPFARRALRVAMGTTFQLDIARTSDAEELFTALRRVGFESYAMTPSADAVDLPGLRAGRRVALVLGSERDGLSDDWMRLATHRVRIPMAEGVDSLNVAAAAAVACYGLTSRNG
jgi:tRNA G18 (ribose-2'-O)-methylase SpoU